MCFEVSFNWQTASSANGDLDEAAANETTGILNDINGDLLPYVEKNIKIWIKNVSSCKAALLLRMI